ncbi:hypothetical protein RJ639_017472 [Escallonia herrerae]|uniref:Glycoside hydrolase family 28 n=1 Tax=Escallonia herrerae TaxID=1293975 RepID=A0AA89AL21_9ASTE|nr:hypothetical protein RJ639_017472 [Escallonia herrerae]
MATFFFSHTQLFSSIFILSLIHLSPSSTSPTTTLSVKTYGAAGDGIQYDTLPIQAAIDACTTASTTSGRPCHVTFPPGTYLTATLFLKSGVVLDIQQNATVLGGTRLEDYPRNADRWYVVVAEDAAEVGITGGGEINGQGLKFVQRFDERKNVMYTLQNLRQEMDCTLSTSLHLVKCNNTSIHDVSIYGDFNTPNNDGIDIDDSNNTVITRCNINTGDDAICPKTYDGPLYNLTATDCWIRTKSSAIKLGSASWFDFKGLVFDNITIVDSHRGLGLQIRDGGNVSDITFSNINITTRYYDSSWWGRAEPIYVTTCPRNSKSKAGLISNLRFVNITATSENGVFLSGSKGGMLSNLKFTNVNLTYRRWTNFADGLVDYRPGCQGLVNHSTAGFIMEHIEGLEVENVNMRWSEDRSGRWNNPLDFRPSTVNNISFYNFRSGLYNQ